MNAVHLYISFFQNESRILKQTKSLIDGKLLSGILIIAVWKPGLKEIERLDRNRLVWRVRVGDKPPRGPIGICKMSLLIIARVIKSKPQFINLHQVLLLAFAPVFRILSSRSVIIYDAHELETETNGLGGVKKKALKLIEKGCIRFCKQIFVVSKSIEHWYRDNYGSRNIETVMNCPYQVCVPKTNHFRKEFAINTGSAIFLYQGALFSGRGIQDVLDAFKLIPPEKAHVVFMGYGPLAEEIRRTGTEYSNIHYFEAVKPDVVLEYTSSADYGISLIQNTCLSYYYCLPNKVFEYLMAGLPVLVSNMKEMREFVDAHQVGVVASSNGTKDIVAAVNGILGMDLCELQQNIENVRPIFNWENEERKMLSAYRRIVGSGR